MVYETLWSCSEIVGSLNSYTVRAMVVEQVMLRYKIVVQIVAAHEVYMYIVARKMLSGVGATKVFRWG